MPSTPVASRLRQLGLALILCGSALLAQAAAPDSTATAAQVNGTTITRAELDELVTTAPAALAAAGQPAMVQMAAVNELISQQLLKQAALRAGLNTQAATQIQLARARRQVLGQAYLQAQVASVPQPTQPQIDQFITSHPKLFGERLTYHFTRATLDASADWPLSRLESELASHKNLPALQNFFLRNQLQLRTESLWLGSEQIAPEQLKALGAMRNGQLKWVTEPGNSQPILLARDEAYPDAKDPAAIRGAIARGMWLESMDAARRAHIDQLRRQAVVITSPPSPPDATLLAATVNNEAITQAQLSQALAPDAAQLGSAGAHKQALRQKMLGTLIEEALLAQQALAQGLERQPAVAAQLKRIETSLLISRYLALEMARLPAPPLSQVNAVVAQQSELFAKRKVYRFSEYIIQQSVTAQQARVQAALDAWTTPQDFEKTLATQGWTYGVNHLWRGPEQLNPQYRKALADLPAGGHTLLPDPAGKALLVLHKTADYPDPVGADEAQRIATQLLVSATQSAATQALLTRLRSEARVALAPDLLAAQQQLMAPVFRLDALSNQQLKAWVLASLQLMLLVLLPAALFWFYQTTRARLEFSLWRDAPTRRLDRWIEASYAAPFLWLLTLATGAATVLLALPIRKDIKLHALPQDALLIAAGLGLGSAVTALALYALLLRRPDAKAAGAKRWRPLGGVMLVQLLLTLSALYVV
ncbi:SurA N-terminal domain-containing protein [Rhodoferax sp.]|uniref:SurA N-terminal domain-containing protein n=1 Tax=Rhodoferax sp. TaxID=50421 RepID=UPI00260D990C|nr:SurA N-terminal domain-containing protein [Rhodoferax sp.]MDD3935979.1 SurA N-terminal domain-containing protein [Rhodoferax sp.]